MPRVGQVGLGEQNDVMEGIVVMRKSENIKRSVGG